jgi:hypothetical protein
VKFSSQVRELGWNNVLNDVLMNAHLAYRSNRAYVFMDHEWLMRHYPWPPEVAHEDPPLTPMAALMSGPAVGGEWPQGTKSQGQNALEDSSTPPLPPRAVSSTWFDLVCPPHRRRILNTSDVKPWQRWDLQARSGREVFDIWQLLLSDRASLDNVTNPIPTTGLGSDATIDESTPLPNGQPKGEEDEYEDEGNDNCLEIVSGSREEDMFPQVFDLWLWGTPRILDLWEEFKASPISTGLGASPIVERCVQRNMHLFSRHLRADDQSPSLDPEDLDAIQRRQALTTVERDPLERALAVHVRRGDYKEACVELANWNSTFYSWNQLPFLPDRFTPPPYPGKPASLFAAVVVVDRFVLLFQEVMSADRTVRRMSKYTWNIACRMTRPL